MIDATVTIKCAPADLDVVRRALEAHAEVEKALGKDASLAAKERHEHNAEALSAEALLGRLR